MSLTKDQAFSLEPSTYKTPHLVVLGISNKFACGISIETARKICEDYKKQNPLKG